MLKNIYAEKNNTFKRCIIIYYIYISYKYRQNIRAHPLFIWTFIVYPKIVQGHFFQLVKYVFIKTTKMIAFYERYFKINFWNMVFYSNSKNNNFIDIQAWTMKLKNRPLLCKNYLKIPQVKAEYLNVSDEAFFILLIEFGTSNDLRMELRSLCILRNF